MRLSKKRFVCLIISLAVVLFPGGVIRSLAAGDTYSGQAPGTILAPSTGNFTAGFNGTGLTGYTNPSSGDTLYFAGVSNYTATDDLASFTVGGLTFTNTGNVTIATSAASNVLTLGASSTTISLSNLGTLSIAPKFALGNSEMLFTGTGGASLSGTLTGSVSGSSYLTFEGSGAVTFTGSGSTLGAAASTGDVGADTSLAVGVNSSNTVTFGSGASLTATGSLNLGSGLLGSGTLYVNTTGTNAITFGGNRGDEANAVGENDSQGQLYLQSGVLNFTNSTGNSAASGATNGGLNGGTLLIGAGSGLSAPTGTVTVSGGTLNVGTRVQLAAGVPSNAAGNWTNATSGNAGTLTISGGTVNIGTGSSGDSDNGWLYLGGPSGGNGTATVNLNGGTLSLNQISAGSQASGSTESISFNGGTLQARSSNGNFLQTQPTLTTKISTGGATIDTNGFNDTISSPLIHDSALGSVADAGLTKISSGILTLSGANTYTGKTTVSSGSLALSGTSTISSSNGVAVSSNAIFDISNSTNNQTITDLSGAGTVNLGSKNLTAGTSTASDTFAGVIQGSGNFTKQGTGTVTLTGTNTYTGSTTVTGGVLDIAKSMTGTSSLKVTGGSLLFGSTTPVPTNTPVTLGGGTLGITSGGGSTMLGALTLTNGTTSVIDFGSGSMGEILTISSLMGLSSTTTLKIYDYTTGASSDHFVLSGGAGSEASFLSDITFYAGNGTSPLGTGMEISYSGGGVEIIPAGAAPEPTTILAGGGLLLIILVETLSRSKRPFLAPTRRLRKGLGEVKPLICGIELMQPTAHGHLHPLPLFINGQFR